MLLKLQPVEPRTRRVDQPQAAPSVLLDRDRWIHISGGRDDASFPASHLLHEARLKWDAVGAQRDILKDEDDFRRGFDLGNGIQFRPDNDWRSQAAPDLARDRTVHVGVDPEGTAGVPRREWQLVLKSLIWSDHHETVVRVAGWRDMQAVEVQVRLLRQAIRKADTDSVPGPRFDERTGNLVVIAVPIGLTAGEREPPGLRFQVRLHDAGPRLKGQRRPPQNQARANTGAER